MTMTGKEKLYFLLDAIDNARTITPSGQPLLIDPTNDLNRRYRDIELLQLFTKLEKDEKVLKVLQSPYRVKTAIFEELGYFKHMDDGCYYIKLLPSFDEYFLKIQHEPEYQEFTGKKPAPAQDLKTRYDQLIDEINPKQNLADLEERYKKLINEIKPTVESPATFPQEDIQEQDRPTPQSKRDLRKEINRIIKARKFGTKEISFLKLLAEDFEPKTIEEIGKQISTKDCKHLKGRVQSKIKNTGFSIKTIKASGWGDNSSYQLKYLPTVGS